MNVYSDKWDKVYNIGEEMEIRIFSEVENLIKRLDQSIYTQIVLNGSENYLLIGGGNGQYIVTFVIGTDEDFYTLINRNKKDIEKEIIIITGGQAGSFSEKMVVDYTSAIEASHYYFEHQDKKPDLLWINE